ncbi:hypothetical protein Q73_05615 [Bacillus coahuilensis m2-6]|uniref:flagellar assembly protein FliH n=1 Tax=Bacillus coahuilensis TaxID=408580 RepID=UPI0007502847|nr:flagellar assembly protein FliH [Bacillus coahuilensis]KUP08665.1 hypothetical protein Q73_05615 [Bacillus coahuilensis m2-6]
MIHTENSLNTLQKQSQDIEELTRHAINEANDIKHQAQHELEQAREEINQMRQALEIERNNLFESTKLEAYQMGFNEGREVAQRQYSQYIQEAIDVVNETKRKFHQHVQKGEEVILELGIEAARKIIGHQLEKDSTEFISIVKTGLKEAREMDEIQIHVHPTQYSLVSSFDEDLKRSFPPHVHIYFYPNDELGSDECYLESKQGRIMVSVDSQLEELRRQLFELLERDSH